MQRTTVPDVDAMHDNSTDSALEHHADIHAGDLRCEHAICGVKMRYMDRLTIRDRQTGSKHRVMAANNHKSREVL